MKHIQRAFDTLIGVTESRLDELCKENFDLTNEIQEMNTTIRDLEDEIGQLKLQLSEALN